MQPIWTSGKELLERWKIKGIELFRFVQDGLQPYTQLGALKPSPDVTEKVERLKEIKGKICKNEAVPRYGLVKYDAELGQYCPDENEDSFPDLFREEHESLTDEANKLESDIKNADISWKDYKLPDDEDEAIAVVNDLVESMYMTEDVKKHTKEQDVKATTDKADSNDEKPSNESTIDNQLSWNGNAWEITFAGYRVHETFKDTGIKAIAYIIERGGKSIDSINLAHLVNPVKNQEEYGALLFDPDPSLSTGSSCADFSDEDLQKFECYLTEFSKDPSKGKEFKDYMKFLKGAYIIVKKDRDGTFSCKNGSKKTSIITPMWKKARKAQLGNIKNAIKTITKNVECIELGIHLSETIKYEAKVGHHYSGGLKWLVNF
ncbi:MAG: hypothetical protein WCJ37_02265 [Syntrophus sp. (in: bacteria)]